MTKKDYILFADLFQRERARLTQLRDRSDSLLAPRYVIQLDELDEIVRAAAHCFADDNPRFSYARFYTACGLE